MEKPIRRTRRRGRLILVGVCTGLVGVAIYLAALASGPPVYVVEHELRLEASPQEVWQVLVDTSAYPEWNPYIRKLEGKLAVGEVVRATLAQSNWPKPRTVAAQIVGVSAARELHWHGRLGIPGILETDHFFRIEDRGRAGVIFIQREEFRGWLAQKMHKKGKQEHTLESFRRMNEALAVRVAALADAH